MSKTIPSELIISDVSIINMHRTYATESISGIQYRRDSGIQKFQGTITLTAEGYEGAKILNGFIAGIKGKLEAFEIQLGGAFSTDGIVSDPVLVGTHNIGSTSLNVSSFSGADIVAGSVFNLPNETKLYTILETLLQTGNSSLTIVPAVKVSHSSSEILNFTDPKFTAILNSNETTITHTQGGLISSAVISWSELLY